MKYDSINILVIGTPGSGKTTFCQRLFEETQMKIINVADLIKTEKLYEEWDDEHDCAIFDDDMVNDRLDELLETKGNIVEFHSCDFMNPEWFDYCVILHCDTTILWDRLEKRGYTVKKIQENVQCEIFQLQNEDANELFDTESNTYQVTIVDYDNNNLAQLESNVTQFLSLLNQ